MGDATVHSLLRAVRRRLWRERFAASARWASWGSAGLMVVALALHLAARPVRVDEMLLGVAALWAALLAWAGSRPPSEAACALWADRHLGGASAYSTLLEVRDGARTSPSIEPVRWLEQWAEANVPQARHRLAARRDSTRLLRPLLLMGATTALATLVLALTGLGARLAPDAVPAMSDAADRASRNPVPLASSESARELGRALQSAGPHDRAERGNMGKAPAGGAGKGNDRSGAPGRDGSRAPAPGERVAVSGSRPGVATDGTQSDLRTAAPGAGSGRDAGESADPSDPAVTRRPDGTMPALPRESIALRKTNEEQADMANAATFDEAFATPPPRGRQTDPVPAAAPPPAAMAARLTPAAAAYVHAWMNSKVER
jgi:hypothetical protein